ncbi:MAG: hypothetical protein K2Y29_03085 [Beijerinckiaceae bacterium]|nr:hypothetical protein [Beijerinckiaceae bacterium]
MTFARKTFTAAFAALAVSASTLATMGGAEAGQRRYHYHGGGYNNGGAVVAGVVGALALGAIAASASRRSYGYDAGYGYAPAYSGGYGYSDYAPAYQAQCYNQKQRVYDNWGNYVGKQIVRVCN